MGTGTWTTGVTTIALLVLPTGELMRKLFPKMLSKSFIDDSKELECLTGRFIYTVARRKCTSFSPLQIGLLGHLTFVDFISDLIAVKFLVCMNHKLVSLLTLLGFFSHGYRVIQISKFCTQTGSVRNGWNFPFAKWTELAL